MKKFGLGILIGIVVLALSGIATAGIMIPAADKAKEVSKAPENSPVIDDDWSLPDCGKPICPKEFIHYVGQPVKAPQSSSCYKLLGVTWKTLPVNYVINPTNSQGLTENFVNNAISNGAETWDANTISELFNPSTISSGPETEYRNQNYVNAVSFGNYPDSNVIAVTTIWYTPVGRKIVEFDVMFDTDWAWGDAAVNPSVMDLQNIAIHELGHGVGLGDIYSSSCSEVTMYGYSNYGETKKRTLELPDITGLQKMYGL